MLACHLLGLNYPLKPTSATELEKFIGVSGKYIEKIMRGLTARGIVTATRGATGGYFLAKAPKEITVLEIVKTFEDDLEIIECVKKDGNCKCCPTQRVWKRLHEGINDILNSITLDKVINGEL